MLARCTTAHMTEFPLLVVAVIYGELQMEDHFAALKDLVDGTPLTTERCSSIRDILLEIHHCCSESGARAFLSFSEMVKLPVRHMIRADLCRVDLF